jgi:D-arabinose 1-dehydrogenase-like Zn-dependent alcohol dehydrogenase
MRAMVLLAPRQALRLSESPAPDPGTGQVLIKVSACAV